MTDTLSTEELVRISEIAAQELTHVGYVAWSGVLRQLASRLVALENKTDFEVLSSLLKKLPQTPVSTPDTTSINIRTNGFIFDESGGLVDHWAEYD